METGTRIYQPSEFKTMPWKNGGGSTTELALYPKGSSLSEPFVWRISLADLNGSGPFSSFPGYDRLIMQISGQPMTLHHEGQSSHKLIPLLAYPFAGEWITRCELEGKAQDYNLMVRREKARGELECLQLTGSRATEREAGDTQFLYALKGECEVRVLGASLRLGAGHGLEIEGHRGASLEIRGDGAAIISATITAFDGSI